MIEKLTATCVHALSYGPVLLKVSMIALDRGSIGALLLPDLVSTAVRGEATILGRADVVRWIVISH